MDSMRNMLGLTASAAANYCMQYLVQASRMLKNTAGRQGSEMIKLVGVQTTVAVQPPR
jgi:hypothetical protein